ncbi:MAG TPA: NAD(P)-dependent oxidoreductase [Patescibacteria group bacterium]|nr:NAD(P)-dependent oxidoreductase [Patescibacteria group bacterium]
MPKYQKISITGASGFVGRNLVDHLASSNFLITVLDLNGASYPKSVKVVKGNLLTKEGLDEFLQGSDILIHLAGQVLSGNTSMDEGNVYATKNLIMEASKRTVKKIIFSSSIAVYGSSDKKFFKESDKCHPDTKYGMSKLRAERIIEKWGKKDGNQYTILRFFSLYGSGNKKGVVYDLCSDVFNKGVITVYGDGKQKRDLVFVEDAVKILSLAIKENLEGIYNIGTGKSFSVLDLISILEKISDKKSRIVFKKQDKRKVNEIFYSVEKIKNALAGYPK